VSDACPHLDLRVLGDLAMKLSINLAVSAFLLATSGCTVAAATFFGNDRQPSTERADAARDSWTAAARHYRIENFDSAQRDETGQVQTPGIRLKTVDHEFRWKTTTKDANLYTLSTYVGPQEGRVFSGQYPRIVYDGDIWMNLKFEFETPLRSFGLNLATIEGPGRIEIIPNGDLLQTSKPEIFGFDQSSPRYGTIETVSNGFLYSNFSAGDNLFWGIVDADEPMSSLLINTSSRALEVDNLYLSEVPLPGAAPLFASGIAGIAVYLQRRRRALKKADSV
jgi:hypothetical protein